MSNTSDNVNFDDYYNTCPKVIIRNRIGTFYAFSGDYPGGVVCTDSEPLVYGSGYKYDGFNDDSTKLSAPWKTTYQLTNPQIDYRAVDTTKPVSTIENDNASTWGNMGDLHNQKNIYGYMKQSNEFNKGSTKGYINAKRDPKVNYAFSVYTKKPRNDFLLDLYNLNDTTFKTKINDLATQYTNLIIQKCNGTNITTDICPSVRQTTTIPELKKTLNSTLSSYCANDTNINTPVCLDVFNNCNLENAVFDDVTVPDYKCNTLINSLKNNDTKNKLLSKTNLTKLTNLTPVQKKTIVSTFNTDGTTAVEDALCALATNTNDPICSLSKFVNTTPQNPILVMYFNSDNTNTPFAVPNGMDYFNSLSFTSFVQPPSTQKYFNVKPKVPLTSTWYAKFYVYLIPVSPDQYSFSINTNKGARVYLNNTLIIDAWNTPNKLLSSMFIPLLSDVRYLLYIEYVSDSTGNPNLQLSYNSKLDKTSKSLSIIAASKSNISMAVFNPLMMTQIAQGLQSIEYCTTNNRFATDPICTGTSSNLYNGFNNIYTSNINDATNVKFQNTIMDYCSTDNKFATDTIYCNNPTYQQFLLNPKTGYNADQKMKDNMTKYCSDPVNNKYSTPNSQNYCRTTDNDNNKNYTKDGKKLNMKIEYADAIRTGRSTYMSNALQNSLSTNTSPIDVTQDVIDYIAIDYPIIQGNGIANANIDNNIINYCADPKYNRFATDSTYCNNPTFVKNVLKTNTKSDIMEKNIGDYCYNNSDYTTPNSAPYCRTVDNINNKNYTPDGKNLNMRVEYADSIRNNRLKYVQNSIKDTIRQTNGNTTGEISPGVVDYINNDISIMLDNKAIPQGAEHPILMPEIYPYCENVPDYKKNKLCNTIYSKFSNDPNVIASTTRINDFNYGISSNAFMGKSDNDVANNAYTAARDAPDSFAKYLPYAINYCGTNDNIVSDECTKYYNNVSNVINNGLASQYKSNSIYKTPIMQQDILNQINSAGMPMPKNTNPVLDPVVAPVATTIQTTIPTTPTPATTSTFSNYKHNNDCDDDLYNSNYLYHIILFICLLVLTFKVMILYNCKNKPLDIRNRNYIVEKQRYNYV